VVLAAAAAACAACGKRKETAPATAAEDGGVGAIVDPRVIAEPVVVDERTWKDRPEPTLRALATAFENFSSVDAARWLAERKLPRPDGVPPEAPESSVQAAVDALVAWDGSGALAPMPCMKGGAPRNPIPLGVMHTAEVAFELSNGPADAPAHAALRMGLALQADGNDPLAMMVGARLSEDATESFTRRGITTPVPANLLPAADLPWKLLASNARCVVWSLDTLDLADPANAPLVEALKEMGRTPEQAIAEEAAAVKAFWAETLKQAAAVKSRADLLRVLDRRLADAQAMRPRSSLVPLLGSPYAARMFLRDAERSAGRDQP
jgi:hypothetical protein